jgi:hypothetical protein
MLPAPTLPTPFPMSTRLLSLLLLPLCACCPDNALPPFSAADVVAWAELDRELGGGEPPAFGQADGRAVLGNRVLALNGEELHRFLRAHGYGGHGRPIRMRRAGPGTLDVELEILGKDGARMRLILRSSGLPEGVG